MSKKITGIILTVMMCVMSVVPAMAATTTYTYIESTSITLKYEDFKAGSSADDGDVTVTLNGTGGLYQLESTAMSVPTNGWVSGDVPNLRVTLCVCNEDTTRFAYSASRPSGVSVDGGDPHYGELRSNSKKVYYEIHLNEVQEDDSEQWQDEKDWNDQQPSNQSGPGLSGAWLRDPNTNRYWYSNGDGSRNFDEWQKISNIWYYFDEEGYRVENKWIKWKGKDYYLGANGRMYCSEYTPDGYWVTADGSWDGKPKK